MTIDALYPVSGDHAIQSVAFVLEWPTPLSKQNLQSIRALAESFKPWFPVMQEHKSVTIAFGMQGGSEQIVQPQLDELAGIHFLQPNAALGPTGMTRALQVNKDNLAVIINDYTRWDEVWQSVSDWLSRLMPFLLDGRPLTAAVLQYNDVLEWRGDPAKLVLTEVIRHDSVYLSPSIFAAKFLWHSHLGYMEDRDIPLKHRLTDNVNVSLQEINKTRAVTLFTSHHAVFDEGIWEPTTASTVLHDLMVNLHNRNKEIVRGILTAEVCTKIHLN